MNTRFSTFACCFAIFFLTISTQAETSIPSIIGENMVLQRNQPIVIWGWDQAGQKVDVSVAGHSAQATTDSSGQWIVSLEKLAAGGPHTITIKGSSELTLKNVLVGEVWLCSGQSNMEWVVQNSDNPQKEIANSDHPNIRHIKFPHRPSAKPEDNIPSSGWQKSEPKTVGAFTAVGYFFARHLQAELDIPIGLIGSNWGGTRIEPWTSPSGFKSVPALKSIADNLKDFPTVNSKGQINHQSALALYNGMIHNFRHFNFQGALWYQGESNRGDGMMYYEKKKALINGWRDVFSNPDMPFLFVQLAPYTYGGSVTSLPEIWEAQTATLQIENTGMAVTVDIGNIKDIHPRNKQDVGKRLALWALANTYGQTDLVYSGPLYKSHKTAGDKITISFNHVGAGLTARDGKSLSHFEVAGTDKAFVAATAVVVGDNIVVSAPNVKAPVAVRFAWHQLAEPNLSNKNGLPASPFRTDKW
jgi:sialate O-acetylesterase